MSKQDLENQFRRADIITSDPQYGSVSYYNDPVDPPRYAGGGAIKGYASAGSVKSTASAIKKAVKKASEALGEHEGKYLNITQSDRMRVGGKDLGGPGFPTLSLERPEYEGAVWGVGNPSVASTIIGANKRYPEGQAIWTTMIGSPEQHRSNQHVFDELHKQFKKSAKAGNLDPVLHDAINQRLRMAIDADGLPMFPEDIDILARDFKKHADRFDKRAVAADVMGGVGIGGKKGQIFDYNKVMSDLTDPMVKDVPAGSLGYRLFTLSGEKSERPDLHSAFPHILHGEDLGVSYTPAPREIIMQKWIEDFQNRTGRKPGFLDWTRGYAPSTQITEEMLTNLQREGFAQGGEVKGYGGGGLARGAKKIADTTRKVLEREFESLPAVSRIDMNYKDVTKRIPELTEAAKLLDIGAIDASEYDRLVNTLKPVEPYDFVPKPATFEDAMRALTKNKQPMYGKTSEIPAGEQADLRLDIPAYKDHGVWVNSIHRKDAPTVYGPVSSVKNATMIGAPEKAFKVAKGETPKAPFAVIRGEWNPIEQEEAVAKAQEYLKHPDWVQVGYDPERHGYFYGRHNMQPIEGAEEIIQIGPLVLAKNPKYAEKAKQKYAQGGDVKGYKKGGDLEDEFRKADMIDMRGFRQDPLENASERAVFAPKKENPYLGVARRLKKIASLPIEIGKGVGEATGEELKHIFTSPTGKRDYGANLAADLAGQLEDTQPAYSIYRALKGEKPLREQIMGDTKPLPFTTLAPQMISPIALTKKGSQLIKNAVRGLEDKPAGMSIKPVGGQWFPRGVEFELEDLKMADTESPVNKAVNAWVNGTLRKYLMNRMGTESDEVRKLFDAGIHHVDPANLKLSNYVDDLEANRRHNYYGKQLAKTSRGRDWEDASDSAIFPRVAGNLGSHVKKTYPWIEKLPPEEKIYALSSNMDNNPDVMRNLGFDHVIDVLKSDILEGKLRPEQLNKVSIEDAIKRTHNYNIEMAKKAEEAGTMTQQGMPIHREYPEGYKWVELKYPEGDKKRLDEIDSLLYGNRIGGDWKPRQYGGGEIYLYKEDPYTKVQGVPASQTLIDSSGRPKSFASLEDAEAEASNLNSKGKLSEDDVKALREERIKLSKEYAEDQTKKALQYEGDTMGHCAGTYCEKVMGGKTRVFSLRDAEGKPHVTVEVTAQDAPEFYGANKHHFEGNPELQDYVSNMSNVSDVDDVVRKMKEMGIEPVIPEPSYKIQQIKGRGNSKPADKYIPYVQDFVKNPVVDKNLSVVGDFQNTNLIDARIIREHGVVDSDIYREIEPELERIYPLQYSPSGLGLLESEHGRLISPDVMLKNQVQDLTSPYITKEDIINHLRSKEALPVEQSYSKYYENLPKEEGMKKGGSALAKGKEIIKKVVEDFSGEPQLVKPFPRDKVLPRNVAYNTYEQVPYAYSGHLEGMPEKSYLEKLDFTDEANWERDGDLLAKYLGMKAEPSQRGVGLYTPPEAGAKTEMNPQISTRTRVNTDQEKRWRNEMTPESQGSMSAMGATRGYFDVQGASPWVKPSEGGKRKYSAFHVVIDGKPTQEEMMKLGEIQNKYGFYGTSDLGKSGVFIGFNFDYGPKHLKTIKDSFESDVKDALGKRVKGVKMVKSEGDYPAFEEQWKEPQGSGAVTRQFMEYLDSAKEQNPLLAEFYAQRPSTELQKLMQDMNIRDIKAPEKYGVGAPRKDVMNARDIFSEYGLEGLRDALNRGEYLPAAVAVPTGIELFKDDK